MFKMLFQTKEDNGDGFNRQQSSQRDNPFCTRSETKANQLGTVRELISRNLMRLQAEGLSDVDARQIVVKDMKDLSALREAAP